MKIYLAGPMSGIPFLNFPAFDEARDYFSSQGVTVCSPADIDRGMGVDEQDYPTGETREFNHKELLHRDILVLSACDAIALLPGWEGSRGARMELFAALFLRLKVFNAETGKKFLEHVVLQRLVDYLDWEGRLKWAASQPGSEKKEKIPTAT